MSPYVVVASFSDCRRLQSPSSRVSSRRVLESGGPRTPLGRGMVRPPALVHSRGRRCLPRRYAPGCSGACSSPSCHLPMGRCQGIQTLVWIPLLAPCLPTAGSSGREEMYPRGYVGASLHVLHLLTPGEEMCSAGGRPPRSKSARLPLALFPRGSPARRDVTCGRKRKRRHFLPLPSSVPSLRAPGISLLAPSLPSSRFPRLRPLASLSHPFLSPRFPRVAALLPSPVRYVPSLPSALFAHSSPAPSLPSSLFVRLAPLATLPLPLPSLLSSRFPRVAAFASLLPTLSPLVPLPSLRSSRSTRSVTRSSPPSPASLRYPRYPRHAPLASSTSASLPGGVPGTSSKA